MTIASEITRLQNDKAAMCAAIENKGVTVGNVTLDDYACCIDAIQTGANVGCVDVLVVGGGGGGGCSCQCYIGGGGGGGGYIFRSCYKVDLPIEQFITIGAGGAPACNGGDSKAFDLVAKGGGCGGNGYCNCEGGTGGNGGGGGMYITRIPGGGEGTLGQGNAGGTGGYCCSCFSTMGGGGGGAGGVGGAGFIYIKGGTINNSAGKGGNGIQSPIDGKYYSAGGGGGGSSFCQYGGCGGCCGGGNGGNSWCAGCNATCFGAGGGGAGYSSNANYAGGCGCQGAVLVRYKTDGTMGVCNLTGGCKYTSGNYTIHCFTSDGFLYEGSGKKMVKYTLVGGGGGGGGDGGRDNAYNGGGGGGAVVVGGAVLSSNETCVIIGCGGRGGTTRQCQPQGGGMTCFGACTARGGNAGWQCGGGASGNGNSGGTSTCFRYGYYAGGGGAGGPGIYSESYGCKSGGKGINGCGGGGGGYFSNGGYDGGGGGVYYGACNATCYGGGGGAGQSAGGCGYQGVAEICYPADGSWGINTSTGGNECGTYICGGITYCIHKFTSNGTFTVTS